MIRTVLTSLILAFAILTAPALAVAPEEVLDDPALEARARALSAELRCMVCQNQSIDDSDAPLAKDLRVLVRERLVAGDSDGQVIDYLVSRYGEFVLLKPRFAWHTLVLWAAGPVALLAGLIAIVLALRSRSRRGSQVATAGSANLSQEEEERLKALLEKRDVPGNE
ncbi:MAG: cytochrome c-type biogenesis protein CcmH [Roseibium album]|uniref:cytochrome c-type biogenesis protein n=1 Tax=Roseibium album TaxID=311410 RepID=UPI0018CB18CD|nr:cytochrome c-type biogenesis protein CcmH [Labrenzia sp. EL_13]